MVVLVGLCRSKSMHVREWCFLTLTAPLLDEVSRQDPHESGQTDQLHTQLLQHFINGAVELGSAAVQLVIHDLSHKTTLFCITNECMHAFCVHSKIQIQYAFIWVQLSLFITCLLFSGDTAGKKVTFEILGFLFFQTSGKKTSKKRHR